MTDHLLWFNDYLSIPFGNNYKINPWLAPLILFKSDHFNNLYFKREDNGLAPGKGTGLEDQAVKVSASLGHRQHLVWTLGGTGLLSVLPLIRL